jgi:hypothetical protein
MLRQPTKNLSSRAAVPAECSAPGLLGLVAGGLCSFPRKGYKLALFGLQKTAKISAVLFRGRS